MCSKYSDSLITESAQRSNVLVNDDVHVLQVLRLICESIVNS